MLTQTLEKLSKRGSIPLKTSMNLPMAGCSTMSVFCMSIIPILWADGTTGREKCSPAVLGPVGATISDHDGRSSMTVTQHWHRIEQTSFARTSLVEVVCDDRIFHQYRRRLREEIHSAVSMVTCQDSDIDPLMSKFNSPSIYAESESTFVIEKPLKVLFLDF